MGRWITMVNIDVITLEKELRRVALNKSRGSGVEG